MRLLPITAGPHDKANEPLVQAFDMATTKYMLPAATQSSYLDCVRTFPLVAIRAEKHLRAAQEVMDGLLAKGRLSAGELLYLDALSDLAAAYEDEHHPIEPASDADMLRHLIESKAISQVDLHRATGIPKSTISEILAGKKPFSRQVIRKLSAYFGIDKSVLSANL